MQYQYQEMHNSIGT